MALTKENLNNFLPNGFETQNKEGYKENFSPDKIAIGYEKDVKDRVSGPNFNNLIDVTGKNFNTLDKYVKYLNDMPINSIPTVDSNNKLNYLKKDELGAGLPVGSIFAHSASASFVPENSVPTDGMEYRAEQFNALWNDFLILKRLETCTYEEYQQEVTTNGACAKFGIDTIKRTFKVPLIPDGYYIKKGQGTANKAGLPNIGGHFGVTDDDSYCKVGETSGVFYNMGVVKGVCPQANAIGNNTGQIVGFDASRSNPIYGKSSTVETNAVAYRYFVVVATGSIKQSEMDWSQWASNLQSKANADLSNCTKPYVVESYHNGYSGYNLYSNGYCEQWGRFVTQGTGHGTLTFFVPYKSKDDYSIVCTGQSDGPLATFYAGTTGTNWTGEGMELGNGGAFLASIYWIAKGFTNRIGG